MGAERCLGCYGLLDGAAGGGYHAGCSRKLFGTPVPPVVDFGMDRVDELARIALSRHLGLTGVQPKISVDLEKSKDDPSRRLRITGLWGNFILKPPTPRFADLPVIEDATMRMAEAAGIRTAPHGLVRLASGELAYVTRRFDRVKRGRRVEKVAVEDFCQLSGLLTERKYKTSLEKAGKIILRHSSNPGLDAVSFLELALFSFLTGNADMHLKNFSLVAHEGGGVVLAPAYDLVSTRLLPIDDAEESALTVNGRKARLGRPDFEALAATLGIHPKAVEHAFDRLGLSLSTMRSVIGASFLPSGLKDRYLEIVAQRAAKLGIR